MQRLWWMEKISLCTFTVHLTWVKLRWKTWTWCVSMHRISGGERAIQAGVFGMNKKVANTSSCFILLLLFFFRSENFHTVLRQCTGVVSILSRPSTWSPMVWRLPIGMSFCCLAAVKTLKICVWTQTRPEMFLYYSFPKMCLCWQFPGRFKAWSRSDDRHS